MSLFRRPWPLVALAFVTANASVVSFAMGAWEATWLWFWATFLVYEVSAAVAPEPLDTLSEFVWLWFGIKPRRAVRLIRIPVVGQFMLVLGAHFVTGGSLWWTGGPAVIVTAIPVAVVIAHSVYERKGERMGLGSLVGDIRHLLVLKQVRDRLREAGKMGKLKVVAFALVGAAASGVVAQVTGACPGLVAALPGIITAIFGGTVTYLMRRPLQGAKTKAALTAAVGFGMAAGIAQLDAACGEGFVHKIPALATAGAWVGIGLWLRAPHEIPPVSATTPAPFTLK